jgi:hypothetical protein
MSVGDEVIFCVKKTEMVGKINGERDNYYYIKVGDEQYYIQKELVRRK